MTRTIASAVAIAAFACGLSVSSASAKHHVKHHVYAHAEESGVPSAANSSAEQIQGVNPMTNSPTSAPAPNKQPYVAVPGVNPM
jgi:hypothetical protein